ncbi:AcrR family transcriptional regulator [Crossiella equi]|uniref:AcrR family transcriptional regulator n=1 Tax=Crossiella equi TaxID=130796 RepID=A0ABS5ACQ5_9PSEU|nr:TetR/AcrR family transcriptional regulator [Crossiella equi]MBP2474367.1 AcrR family transcriptional regulator [Crossiella equi]
MARLTRAELQEQNRARVLHAARAEFAERGYRDAKIDEIAERAGLTRGAVYSNFPGKRALYFAVLADAAFSPRAPVEPGDGTPRGVLAAFARSWLAHSTNPELVGEVLAEEDTRGVYAQLLEVQSVLLGELVGEVRARLALTALHGAGQLAGLAPDFLPRDAVVRACGQLADLDVEDPWRPPAGLPPVTPVDQPWPDTLASCAVHAGLVELNQRALLVFPGPRRLGAVADLVRGTGEPVTVVLGGLASPELRLLAGLVLAGFGHDLRAAGARGSRVSVLCDAGGAALADRLGVHAEETAVRVSGGRVTARADGAGAGYALTR